VESETFLAAARHLSYDADQELNFGCFDDDVILGDLESWPPKEPRKAEDSLVTIRDLTGDNLFQTAVDWEHAHVTTTAAESPASMEKLIKRCWHGRPSKRPSISSVVDFLSVLVRDHDGEDV
jgi:hypothetical protein